MRRQADQIVERLSTYSEEETKDRRSLVLYQDDWHQGVIGIVAGRLKETHHVPAIVFAPADTGKVNDNDAIKGRLARLRAFTFVMPLSKLPMSILN